jgi:pyridoxine kinase
LADFHGHTVLQIVSVQSRVAYGHVGNSAAVFPLQVLGAEVTAIDTVLFSNHPAYGDLAGDVVPAALVSAMVQGVARRGVFGRCDALLSGYLGAADTGEAVLEAEALLRAARPDAVWCCDPVIGDEGPGVYVRDGIEAFFRERAVPRADLLTPNHFEVKRLTALPCATRRELVEAMGALRRRMRAAGPRIVLVTSVRVAETPAGSIECLCLSGDGVVGVRVPLLPIVAHGTGDIMSALFLYHWLTEGVAGRALEAAAGALHGLLTRTIEDGGRELSLVAASAEFLKPSFRFAAFEV